MTKKKLHVNVVSESAFTVQGHGVHTAFVETVKSLEAYEDTDVVSNKFRRGADITHIHTVGLYGLIHLLFGSGKKVVSAHVTPDAFVGSLIGAKYWYGLSRWYLRFFYNRADVVLAVSGHVVEQLKNNLKLKSRVELLDNTIDTARFANSSSKRQTARENLNIKPDEFVVIDCGQIQTRKGTDTFFKLAKELPDMKFMWVGGMPFGNATAGSSKINKQIANAPDNFSITGVITLDEVVDYYKAADAFLFPSYQETFGLVVVEAAAAGLPVVVRDISDYDATFGQDALRCKENEFATILQKLKQDKKFYHQAQRGSANIAKKYDSKLGVEKLIRIYKNLLLQTTK